MGWMSQGLDMPSRGKLNLEMKKHGVVDDVQMVNKANICYYTFADESYAAAALAAVAQKVPTSWNVPKVFMPSY